jgi:hypothetical protein
MKTSRLFPYAGALCFCAGAALLVTATLSYGADGKKRNPTSKVFVADLTGESQIDTGEKIEALTKKSVYSAEGTIIETKVDSTDSLVLSNGTAIYVGADTRFEVKKFLQEPFSPNRNDLDVEPSISQTYVKIVRGAIGICTSKLVAGSSMVYTTPQATINIRGRKLMIEVEENETRVSLLEGDITVLGDSLRDGQTLKPGQQAIIRKNAADQTATITVQPLSEAAIAQLDEKVALACISRRTVYFEVADRKGGNGTAFDTEAPAEIRPVEVVPANLPTRFTISPARING